MKKNEAKIIQAGTEMAVMDMTGQFLFITKVSRKGRTRISDFLKEKNLIPTKEATANFPWLETSPE